MINSRQQIVTKAAASPTPQGVAVSNITDKSFTVSWTTSIPATGFIKLTQTGKPERTILDDRDQDKGVKISGLLIMLRLTPFLLQKAIDL